jgi:hypothetical protein
LHEEAPAPAAYQEPEGVPEPDYKDVDHHISDYPDENVDEASEPNGILEEHVHSD